MAEDTGNDPSQVVLDVEAQDAAAEDIAPTSKVDVDPVFEGRVRDFKAQAAEDEPSLREGDQLQWFRPGSWEADVFDYEALKEPFDTSISDAGFIEAHKNAKAPGTTGDIITATTQIDYMDAAERAMRARHLYPLPRCVALMAGRKKGHGASGGVFAECATEYVRRLSRQAKG